MPALVLAALIAAGGGADDPPTYAQLDRLLEGEFLVPPDATWRYAVGTAPPSAGQEWTTLAFWDAEWKEGPAPIGYGIEGLATTVEGMEGVATTLYLRCVIDLGDPDAYERIVFTCPVDDGYVLYVNGEEEDRLHAGIKSPVPYDATASSERSLDRLPVPSDDLTGKLVAGPNTFALQGLVHTKDRGSLALSPAVWGRFRRDLEAEALRVRALRKRIERTAPDAKALLAYLEGRFLQRTDRPSEAALAFRRAAALDPEALEPWQRWVECAIPTRGATAAEQALAEGIAAGSPNRALLDTWAAVVLDELGLPPEVLRGKVSGKERPAEGRFADALWAAERIAAGQPLALACGSDLPQGEEGEARGRDRFWTYGHASEGTRVAERELGDRAPLYQVPLAPGTWSLGVTLAEDSPPADLLVEEVRAYRGLGGGRTLLLAVRVQDNRLDLDLVPTGAHPPRIRALELSPLEPGAFLELARRWAEQRPPRDAWAQTQLAEALWLQGDLDGALTAYETVEATPGFSPSAARRLARLRSALLPRVLSFASADALATRPDAPEIARPLVDAEGPPRWIGLYLRGRAAQLSGDPDGAIAAYEEAVFEGAPAPLPYQRMAECLRQSGLAEEAQDILRQALHGGVRLDRGFLRVWITLALEDLGRDPWELVRELALAAELPETIWITRTSEEFPREWQYSLTEPPTTTWSRTSYGAANWQRGPGGIGFGTVQGGRVRSLWENQLLFARHPFECEGHRLLYPWIRVALSDAGDVYLNGTIAHRMGGSTSGYDEVPLRKGGVQEGLNYIGIYGINLRDAAFADAGIYEPVGLLVWILRSLEEGALRLNCGGGDYRDANGILWSADRFFGHGEATRTPPGETSPPVAGTEDDELYRSQRTWSARHEDEAGYEIPLPDGRYAVTLHFAEVHPDRRLPGKRVFGVKLEGETVLEAFDPTETLGPSTAGTRSFETTVSDGWLDLEFDHVKDRASPAIAAIEVRPLP